VGHQALVWGHSGGSVVQNGDGAVRMLRRIAGRDVKWDMGFACKKVPRGGSGYK
jgi:hypothetical protein